MEEFLETYLPYLIHIFEIMGIIILSIGGFKAFFYYIRSLFGYDAQHEIKYGLAQSLATALEFKLASEILKTVLIKSLSELVILASIFILRVLMTFILEWELKQERQENDRKDGQEATGGKNTK